MSGDLQGISSQGAMNVNDVDQQKMLQLFMQAPVAIAVLQGRQHIFSFANELYCRIFSRDSNSVIGRSLREVFPESECKDLIQVFDNVFASGNPYVDEEYEISFLQDGRSITKWFNFVVQPIKDDSELVTGVMVQATELTRHVENLKAVAESDLKIGYSEERFRGAIQAVEGILWTNTPEGKMEGEQRGWQDLTGQSYDEYRGFGWANCVHPEDQQPTLEEWQEAVKEKRTFTFEHRVKCRDGQWRLFSVRAVPLFNKDGSIREWVGVHTDITDVRRAVRDLEESEERFRHLADDSPMFVFIIEPDEAASISYVNREWLQYTGQTLEQIQGTAWNDTIHPADVPTVIQHYAPAFKNQVPYIIPAVRVKRDDGVFRWYSFKGNPRYLSNGKFNGFVGVGIDIHEQKLAEESVKESQALLQEMVNERTAELESQKNLLDNILANSSNGISVTEMVRNGNGEVIDAITILANDAAVQYTGLPREVYMTTKATEVDPNILSSPYGMACLNTLQTGQPSLMQYFLEFTGKWLELTISKMDNEHLIHIFTDITPAKEAQLHLEKTVGELQRSNTNLQEFAYAASHDLKEPIRKIHIFTDRLKNMLRSNLGKEEVHMFERIEAASNRMSSLIDDLLAYSYVSIIPKIDDTIDLNSLINLVLNDLDLEIEQKKATVTIGKLFTVAGHPRQLQQAFHNLIGNALKYSKVDVPPQITISGTIEKGSANDVIFPNRKHYQVTITDNGIGFDQKDVERIFNVFTRLHFNTTYKGTGVGLSIVRKVIENHGGTITAESAPGQGATFRIYLPVI